jgi:superfamily II DNA helicase RecQ
MSSISSTTQNQGSNHTSIDSLAFQLATVSMQETFGHDPHPWQADIRSTLFLKKHGETYLLVRPTGGGKSMIRDTFASAKPGTIVVSLTLLLSLSKDQVTSEVGNQGQNAPPCFYSFG